MKHLRSSDPSARSRLSRPYNLHKIENKPEVSREINGIILTVELTNTIVVRTWWSPKQSLLTPSLQEPEISHDTPDLES